MGPIFKISLEMSLSGMVTCVTNCRNYFRVDCCAQSLVPFENYFLINLNNSFNLKLFYWLKLQRCLRHPFVHNLDILPSNRLYWCFDFINIFVSILRFPSPFLQLSAFNPLLLKAIKGSLRSKFTGFQQCIWLSAEVSCACTLSSRQKTEVHH